MTAPQFPAGLSGLASQYDTILCDVWGVIHNGRAAFTEACDALVKFRAQGGQISLITNAPVPEAQVVRYFEPLGVPKAAFDLCVSSGDATRAELAAHPDRSVWRMGGDEGWEHDRFLYDGLGLTFVDNDSADLLLCIGLRDQVNDQPEDYRAELGRAVAKGLPMLCANPDKQVRVGGKLYWCAGALASIYEDLGGQVIYPGKPYAPIYKLAIGRLTELKAKPQRILCIGDSPATDVRGARRQGFDSLYVGTGLKQHGADFEAEVTDLLADYGEQATYAMTGLRW
ncbi:TIGR01459 family HAD-type hydrolase [Hyphomonas sp.]|uniref:TIGR01459 family HAD-type hydrolase n=1 Tax=Hyphomonas sp. TaxID=87 RepID=UPI0025BDEBBD|nr:TIGR01459 family HAD-type hydrolase [Hyphomonas sp.]MBI1399057.1 TIGR01459 family HAD-type hydrolase [Hyphomonas sp.]